MSKKTPIQCSHCGTTFMRKNGGREKQCSLSCRFWSKVEKAEGCWPWKASIFKQTGYGQFALESKRPINAHRMAWILTHGEIPDGMVVCHHCDNPLCVNPDHLFLGQQQDNMIDMATKGRHVGTRGHKWTPAAKQARSEMMKRISAERKAAPA